VLMVRRGDTLLDLLLSAGIARAEAHEAVSALRSVFNPRDLKPGLEITLTLGSPNTGEQPSLLGASFAANAERDIALSRDSDGRFTALRRNKDLQRELIRTRGTVRSSLFEAASSAGLPGAIMVEMIRALSYDIDFQRDVQPGDAFDVVFERFRDDEGRFAKDGDIIYGALILSGVKRQIYRYMHGDGTTGYYNEKGESVRKALLRTPIDGARLTSGFGERMHPILGYSATHKGADFGAPQGTPVQAAGDGTVELVGWQGAYGQYIRIRHNAEFATAYAHLSRFAGGLRQGDRVRQGQVIGYVGTTGRSTGPHLHYEVIRRGTQINPIAVQLPTVRKLEGEELIQFRTVKAETDLQIAGIEPIGRVARAASAMATR
jgi:murein DD-endopeptidase MepM/ murein hydrolase activator NlpD